MHYDKELIKNTQLKIIEKWIKYTGLIYVMIWIIFNLCSEHIVGKFIYGEYYRNFAFQLVITPCIFICILGCIVNQIVYLKKANQQYKEIKKLSFIACCIFLIGIILSLNIGVVESYKDLSYVLKSSYCEEEKELNDTYIKERKGKYSTVTLYVEVDSYKFRVPDYIADENDYIKFKSTYKNVNKVKIKYLPNTKLLLGIEPVKS